MIYAAQFFTVIPAKDGTQTTVSQTHGGLGPVLRRGDLGSGLRRGDGGNFEGADENINPSICLHFQAKMPQTAIQMRGFKS
jgi:hypothetical protein